MLECLVIATICTVGFILIGVPYALLLGVCAGLFEFIPLVGPLVVAVGTTLIAGFHSSKVVGWITPQTGNLAEAI